MMSNEKLQLTQKKTSLEDKDILGKTEIKNTVVERLKNRSFEHFFFQLYIRKKFFNIENINIHIFFFFEGRRFFIWQEMYRL